MLAGLGPAPAVLFVVAADEGWSRQSAEHLAALDALEVRHGLLAVTRSDLADPAARRWRDARRAAGPLQPRRRSTAVAVSGVTGAGLDELRAALDRPRRRPARAGRRRRRCGSGSTAASRIRGSGTVVTGTLGAGTVRVGDELSCDGRRGDGARRCRRRRRARPAWPARRAGGAQPARRGRRRRRPRRRAAHPRRLAPHRRRRRPADRRRRAAAGRARPARRHRRGAGAGAARSARTTPGSRWPGRCRCGPATAPCCAIPGRQRVAAGVLVLDADPPPLERRGAGRARARRAGRRRGRARPGRARCARRGAVRRDAPRPAGRADGDGRRGAARRPAGWSTRARWPAGSPAAPRAVRRLGRRRTRSTRPMPPAALAPRPGPARRRGPAGRADGRGRPERGAGPRPCLDAGTGGLGPAQRGVDEVVARLRAQPFAAPERGELAELGLGRRELAAAERAGPLLPPRRRGAAARRPRRRGGRPACAARSRSRPAQPGRRWAPRAGWPSRCSSTSTGWAAPGRSTAPAARWSTGRGEGQPSTALIAPATCCSRPAAAVPAGDTVRVRLRPRSTQTRRAMCGWPSSRAAG